MPSYYNPITGHNTGGPAFPVYDYHGDGQQFLAEIGMTLRDYFAAKAMAAYLPHAVERGVMEKDMAEAAYCVADAMIEARQKGGAA